MTLAHDVASLVTADWVADRLGRFRSPDPDYRLVEVDVNPAFYERGHAPGAVGLDWRRLQAPVRRDLLSRTDLETLLGEHGVEEDTTVVLYGDDANWFAAHAYWQLTYHGHADVRLLDGGRRYWVEEGYPTTRERPAPPTVSYDAAPADDSIRAFREDVVAALGTETRLVDVRSAQEFRGERTAPPGSDESALRGGHVPGAEHVFWAENVRADGRFRSLERLRALYEDHGVRPEDEVVVYCRIGERASVAWFVLTELLEYPEVRVYDGSWAEWGNAVGLPIARD